MSLAEDYFARVRPLLGTGLSAHVVSVDDAGVAALVLELLASCMLEHVIVTQPDTLEPLLRAHAWRQPFLPLRTGPSSRIDATIHARRGTTPSVTWCSARREVAMTVDPADLLAWMDTSYHVARTLRDVLLGSVPWPDGTRWYGNPAWPFSPCGSPVSAGASASLPDRHVLVIGCGSVGSEVVRALAGSGARWTLADDARVTVFNLARQWYGAAEVGQLKVDALRQRLARATAWPVRIDEPGALEARLRADPPDLVVLATGTHHHGMIGELLWRLGIPHVAACCYPQARFFEVSVVSPRERTPCLHCFRGHLYRGAPDPTPIPDDVARFLYAPMDDDQRARAYTDLVAEPATKIETLRVAEVVARCAVELLAPRRSAWFDRMLAAETTCLLGGNVTRPLANGDHAYGIREAGQVIRLGVDDLAGAGDFSCAVCDRRLAVRFREELPAIGDDADAALL